jgi:VWA domain-containing protein
MLHAAIRCLFAMSLLVLPVLAQSPGFVTKRDAFQRAMSSGEYGRQVEACREFRGVHEPAAVPLLLKWATKLHADSIERRRRIERDEKEIAEELYKRVEKPRMSDAKRQEARRLVEGQLAPLRAKVEKNRKRSEQNEQLGETIQELVGEVFGALEGEDLEKGAEYLVKEIKGERKPEAMVGHLRVAALAQHPLVTAQLGELAHLSRYPAVRVAALNALANHPGEPAGIAGSEALDDNFDQVRFAAILMLREVGGRESIGPLIKRLGKEKGRLEGEIVKTLATITNAAFGPNAQRWGDWWKEWEAKYEGRGSAGAATGYRMPEAIRKRRDEEAKNRRRGRGGNSGNSFYGIETKAKHIMYILDISGSMLADSRPGKNTAKQGEQPEGEKGHRRIDQAIAQLKRSIESIPSNGSFNIIFYNQDVNIWRKGMQKASKKNKKEAVNWADTVEATGRTNIFDSVEMAFQVAGRGTFDKHYKVAVETIFLLSDGAPNEGRITETSPFLEEVKKLNRLAKVQIHTVGLGGGGVGGLLRQLAEQNHGEFVSIR